MRKNLSAYLRLSMLLLTVFLFGNNFRALAIDPMVLDEEWTPQESVLYSFTPTTDGVMSVQVVKGTLNFQFHQLIYLYANGERSTAVDPNPGYVNNESATWNLRAGQNYCFFDNPSVDMATFIFTFTPGEIEGPQYPEMPFGVEFAGDNLVYAYTPEINETLYILTSSKSNYTFSYMGGLLFTDPAHNMSQAAPLTLYNDNNSLGGFTYEANLTGGTTYYLFARNVISKFICTFDGSYDDGDEEDNTPLELNLNSSFTPAAKAYYYTPDADGVLTVTYTTSPFSNLLYASYNNGTFAAQVPLYNYDPTVNNVYSWEVQKGVTYYLNTSSVTQPIMATFEESEASSPYPILPIMQVIPGDNSVYMYTPEITETLYIYTNSANNYTLAYMGSLVFSDPAHNMSQSVQLSGGDEATIAELDKAGRAYNVTLEGGTTYYFWARQGVDMFCTFDANFGGGGEEDTPAVELPLGDTFTPNADAYYLTADQDGILQITYKTSPLENLLYTQYENGAFSGRAAIAYVNTAEGSNIYAWSLTNGVTYYFDARNLKNNEVTAVFPYVEGGDDALITFVEPAPNSTFNGLMEGDIFRVKVNPDIEDQLVTLTYKITNDQSSQIIQNDLTKGTDGYWQRTIGIDYPFYEGATYTCRFELYNHQMKTPATLIGTQEITWYGNTRFPRSSVIFTGTNPPTDDILELNADGSANFSARFNGEVTVTRVYCPAGQGVTSPCTFTQPTPSTVNVTVSAGDVNTCLQNYGVLRVVIEATGNDGYPVYTDEVTASGETVRRAFVQVDFQTNRNVSNEVAFDVYTLDGDLLEGQAVKAPFTAVKISSTQSSQTINPSNVGTITITDTEANVVARGDYDSFVPSTNPTLNFNVAVTEPGEYIINFPIGAFVFGDGMQALSSAEQTVTFSIVGDEPSYEYMNNATVVDPAQAIVGSVMQVVVTWDEQPIFLKDGATAKWYVNSDFGDFELGELQSEAPDLYLTTLASGDEGGIAQMADGGENALVISLPFSAFFTKGVFNIVVPQATVENENGEVNPEEIITLFVVNVLDTPATISPAETSVETLPEITVTFDNIMLINPNDPMEIRLNQTIISTDEFMTPIQDEDTGDVNGYKFNVSKLTEEKGTYEFVLPEGAFLLIGEDGSYNVNQEGYVEFTVTTSTGINEVVDALDGRYVVYNINGILVLDTDNAAELAGLTPGLYIINGKKVIVRN